MPDAGTRGLRVRRWLRDLLIGMLALAAWGAWLARDLPRGPAPPLAGPGLDGRPLTLESLRGRPVLVHFWATWCPVCRLESDGIAALAEDHAVLTVATTSGDAEALRAWMRERALSFAVLVDESGAQARAWRVSGVPASFVVDAEGRIRWAGVGYRPAWLLRLRLLLAGFSPLR